MRLLKYYLKAEFSNPHFLFWSIAFMVFWLIMGAYVMSKGIFEHAPAEMLSDVIRAYTSSWYSLTTLFSLSSMAVGLTFNAFYSTAALPYMLRFSNLSSRSYHIQVTLGSSALALIIALLMKALTYSIYSHRFQMNLQPARPEVAIGVSVLAGVFFYLFTTLIAYVIIILRVVKSVSFISFAPLLLGFLFGFGHLHGALSVEILYISPYTAMSTLLTHSYSGKPVPNRLMGGPDVKELDLMLMPISLIAWIFALGILDIYLARKVKEVPIAELRVI